MNKFERNKIITKIEQENLKSKKVAVLGLGGLGGYSVELMVRLGIENLIICDYDIFDITNLNRQILSTQQCIGKSKVIETKKRILSISPDANIDLYDKKITEKNIKGIIESADIVIDGLDDNETRLIVLRACRELELPYIYGSIAGWYAYVSTVFPKDSLVESFLKKSKSKGIEVVLGNPSFTPALAASIQASEALKTLLEKGNSLREEILYIDLLKNEFLSLKG